MQKDFIEAKITDNGLRFVVSEGTTFDSVAKALESLYYAPRDKEKVEKIRDYTTYYDFGDKALLERNSLLKTSHVFRTDGKLIVAGRFAEDNHIFDSLLTKDTDHPLNELLDNATEVEVDINPDEYTGCNTTDGLCPSICASGERKTMIFSDPYEDECRNDAFVNSKSIKVIIAEQDYALPVYGDVPQHQKHATLTTLEIMPVCINNCVLYGSPFDIINTTILANLQDSCATDSRDYLLGYKALTAVEHENLGFVPEPVDNSGHYDPEYCTD